MRFRLSALALTTGKEKRWMERKGRRDDVWHPAVRGSTPLDGGDAGRARSTEGVCSYRLGSVFLHHEVFFFIHMHAFFVFVANVASSSL